MFFPASASHSVGYPEPPATPLLSCPRKNGQLVLSGLGDLSLLLCTFFDDPVALPDISGRSARRKKDAVIAAIKTTIIVETRYLLFFSRFNDESGFASERIGLRFSFSLIRRWQIMKIATPAIRR